MNRILKLGLLSVIVGALYSCSSDSLYDPDKAGDVKLAQYEAAFVGKYGAIAPNQNCRAFQRSFKGHCYRECELVGFLCSACLLWK